MIYVVTASHNRKKITSQFACQLASQKGVEIKFVLVDDGSIDGTGEAVKEVLPDAVIIRGNGNLWWGGALNEAYKWLIKNAISDSLVMFSNDDILIPDDYIEKMTLILDKKKKTLVSGCGIGNITNKVVDSPISWDFSRFTGEKVSNYHQSANCASTRSLMFRLEDLKEIGGFHPILLPHYASDYEWTIRASRKGFAIISDESLKYIVREETTGYRDVNKLTFRQIFSKKSNMNPFYRISFLLLITPKKYLLQALYNQIIRLKRGTL